MLLVANQLQGKIMSDINGGVLAQEEVDDEEEDN